MSCLNHELVSFGRIFNKRHFHLHKFYPRIISTLTENKLYKHFVLLEFMGCGGANLSSTQWVNVDTNGPDCEAFMWTVRIWRGSCLQTYLALYAHILPIISFDILPSILTDILPDMLPSILPNALRPNLFGLLELVVKSAVVQKLKDREKEYCKKQQMIQTESPKSWLTSKVVQKKQ